MMKKESTKTIDPEKSKLVLYLVILFMVPAALYYSTINFDFTTYHDSALITNNWGTFGVLQNIPKAFVTAPDFTHDGSAYRPMQTVSFIIDSQFSDGKAWMYHMTNTILFVLIILLLFYLLKQFKASHEIAFVLTLFFAVHPLLPSAICWIPARGDLLLLVFSLLSFFSLMKYLATSKFIFLVSNVTAFLFSVFSKETGLALPLIFLLYIYIQGEKQLQKNTGLLSIFWTTVYIVYGAMRYNALYSGSSTGNIGFGSLAKNIATIPILFGKIFLPINLSSMPLFDIQSLVLGLICLFVFLFTMYRTKVLRNKKTLFGLAWFLLFFLTPLLYRGAMTEIGLEYYEYTVALPMIGLLILAIPVITTAKDRFGFNRMLQVSVPVIIVAAVITVFHSMDYYDAFAFFSSGVKASERNAVAFNERGKVYSQKDDKVDAAADFEMASLLCSNYSDPVANQAVVFGEFGRHAEAEKLFAKALSIDTQYTQWGGRRKKLYYELAVEKIMQQKFNEAIPILHKGTTIDLRNPEIYDALGYIYSTRQQYDSVIIVCNKSLAIAPNAAINYYNRGRAKYFLKDYSSALVDINKALSMDGKLIDAMVNRGLIHLATGNDNGAVSDFDAVIQLNPRHAVAYFNRGKAFAHMKENNKAEQDFNTARQLGYKE